MESISDRPASDQPPATAAAFPSVGLRRPRGPARRAGSFALGLLAGTLLSLKAAAAAETPPKTGPKTSGKAPAKSTANWPEFRGPNGIGHADAARLPLTWSASNHVRWQTALPGRGWSSPVVWDRQVWLTTALDEGHSLHALCVDLDTGRLVHDLELLTVAAPDPIHEHNSHASPTPVVEAGNAYFFFGTYGAVCVDTRTARIRWKNVDLHHDHGRNGPGSSPFLYRDLLILTCDGTEQDRRFLTALDKRTGKPVWTTFRSNGAFLEGKQSDLKKAYHTPIVVSVDGHDELISMGAYRVGGYDPLTGKELWYVDIPGFSNVTRPVFGHGLIYLATGFMKPEFWAIRPGGQGDVTATHVAWKNKRQAPDKPSPVLVGDEVYMVSDAGIATCMDARTGTIHWSERLNGEFSASPLAVGDRIYFFDLKGRITVLRAGTKFERLAESRLPGGFYASPAVVGDALLLRTTTHLYRIEDTANTLR